MGFWVMLISLAVGAFLIYLCFAKNTSQSVKVTLFLTGLILIAGAIFLSTPQGAAFVLEIT